MEASARQPSCPSGGLTQNSLPHLSLSGCPCHRVPLQDHERLRGPLLLCGPALCSTHADQTCVSTFAVVNGQFPPQGLRLPSLPCPPTSFLSHLKGCTLGSRGGTRMPLLIRPLTSPRRWDSLLPARRWDVSRCLYCTAPVLLEPPAMWTSRAIMCSSRASELVSAPAILRPARQQDPQGPLSVPSIICGTSCHPTAVTMCDPDSPKGLAGPVEEKEKCHSPPRAFNVTQMRSRRPKQV